MFERFRDDARRVVVLAEEEARLLNHNYIGTEHILLGLLAEDASTAAQVLQSLDVDLEQARAQVLDIVGHGGSVPSGHIPFTPRAKKVLELSLREALQLGHNYIGTEHILLGLCREGEGVAARVLDTFGADLGRVRHAVLGVLGVAASEQPWSRPRAGTRGMLQSWNRPANPRGARCAFCGRDESRCEHMLVAGGARLCSDCAHDAVAQFDALPDDAPKLARFRRRDVAPGDKDAAVAAIERAFDAVFGPLSAAPVDAVWAVEDGDARLELLETLRAVAEHAPFSVSDITVERVRFLDEDEAEVSLGIWIAGSQQPMLQPAHAVLEGGTWKVRRSTVEHFARQARQFRRPPQP